MSETVLETRNLSKKYRNATVLDDVSVTLKKNRIYGFIGENGAGKSTFMKVVSGLILPSGGSYSLMGETEPKRIEQKRKRVGTMIEEPVLFPGYSVWRNVELQRIMVGNPDPSATDRVIELVGLTEAKDKKARKLSMGMKQRLGIAIALVGNPELLILDEPINGLDPKNIVTMRKMLKKISDEQECTIFISSHILSELYLLATDFIFIHKGKIIEALTHEELEEKCSKYILVRDNNIPETVTILEQHFPGISCKVVADEELVIYGNGELKTELSRYLMEAGILISELSEKEVSLEEYFMTITGGEADD
ncbi:MAG: ABC transporter ATP-binding protein [Lachnospiraceae bacterium]|nr:ABC transporter ATP-binding protein [Lachnospiraceae bacterium]